MNECNTWLVCHILEFLAHRNSVFSTFWYIYLTSGQVYMPRSHKRAIDRQW